MNGGEKPARGLRVLLVDDDRGSVDLFTRMLRAEGHFVISVLSAVEALDILARGITKVEVIVSDLNMPDMSGVEFYREVEKRDPGLEKKIVFITGGVFSYARVEFLNNIPNPKLGKPFKAKELLQAIFTVLSAPGKTDQNDLPQPSI